MNQKLLTKNEFQFAIEHLRGWFEEDKRPFPWRINPTPYKVWVSEVMLQQTKSSVVIPYFERWMERFPTLQSLANAELEEVIKAWEGLGYYSRARALHDGARYILAKHGGVLPNDPISLAKVKGIGPYTVGAILSFAFHQKAAAVDGNVLRVIARLFAIEDEIDQPKIQTKIRQKVEELLPDSQPWVIMEAMIELGAKICTRNPACLVCPIQDVCAAFHLGKTDTLPRRKKRKGTIFLKRTVLVIEAKGEILVQKHQGKKVMANLFEFPYFEGEAWKGFYPDPLKLRKTLSTVFHTFTHYRAELLPTLWDAEAKREIEGYSWQGKDILSELPFSAGHKRILNELLEDHAHLTY